MLPGRTAAAAVVVVAVMLLVELVVSRRLLGDWLWTLGLWHWDTTLVVPSDMFGLNRLLQPTKILIKIDFEV